MGLVVWILIASVKCVQLFVKMFENVASKPRRVWTVQSAAAAHRGDEDLLQFSICPTVRLSTINLHYYPPPYCSLKWEN